MSSAEACKDDPVGVETDIASFVNENVQSDPLTAVSDVANDNSAEEKESADLPLVLENPGDQQGNEMSSAEACKDDPVGVEANVASLVDEIEHSDPSKATTSDAGKENAAEKKETSDLPLVLNTPDVQQINDTSNAGTTSTNYSDTVAFLNEHGLLGSPKAGTDTGDDNAAAEKKETSGVPCS